MCRTKYCAAIRISQAAAELHMSEKQVRALIEAGELVAVRVAPRTFRIPLQAIEHWRERQRARAIETS
jgi:excisionase family DNA binding protein